MTTIRDMAVDVYLGRRFTGVLRRALALLLGTLDRPTIVRNRTRDQVAFGNDVLALGIEGEVCLSDKSKKEYSVPLVALKRTVPTASYRTRAMPP